VEAWNPSEQPEWLTEEFYREKIQPRLSGVTVPAISSALGLSEPYAAQIRAGRYIPHPRHWCALARLVGVSQNRQGLRTQSRAVAAWKPESDSDP
jgi:hypothetical protein